MCEPELRENGITLNPKPKPQSPTDAGAAGPSLFVALAANPGLILCALFVLHKVGELSRIL